MSMELKVKEFTFPEVIEFNYEEIESALQEKMAKYENHIYTPGQMTEAKKDLADLRKFAKAMSDERIRIKKEYMKPCDEFEAKIKKLDAIVQKPIEQINSQVKFFDEQIKEQKKLEICSFFEGCSPFEWLEFHQIFNEKWLNTTTKIPAIQKEIEEIISSIKNDLETLSNLPEFGFEATEVYKTTLDINKAISEGKRLSDMQKRKAEAEAKALEEAGITPEELKEANDEYIAAASANGVPVMRPVENVRKSWISFKALLSAEDAAALKKFFDERGIEFQKIGG